MNKSVMVTAVLFGAVLLGTVLHAQAETASTTATSGVATNTPPVSGVHCMQSVVKKRDTALIAGMEAFSEASIEAITARQEALSFAWGISVIRERNKALRTAWDSFRNSARSAKKALRANHDAAWKQFKVDSRACGSGALYDSNEKSGDAILL